MAVDYREWYALPEVSSNEGRWWEKENARPFHGNLKLMSIINNFMNHNFIVIQMLECRHLSPLHLFCPVQVSPH